MGEGRTALLVHADDPRLRRLAVLDAVINNGDRKGGHLLPAPGGRLYGIDHGVTFNADDKLRTLLWGWAGEPLTDEALRGAGLLGGGAGRRGSPLATRLAQLITAAEMEALRERVAGLLGSRGAPGAERAVAADPVAAGLGSLGRHRRTLRPYSLSEVYRKSASSDRTSGSGSYPEASSGYAHDMHAWPASEVPALPGKGRDLRIHDTATGGRITLDPGPVARIYVCGITPYDATHMGHAATYNAFDLVQRVWLDTKRQVHYVQNVTDVDDPLLERAARDGQDWTELAERETALFREDMTALRMLPPQHYIGAVEAIPGIVPLVERLRDAGAAYELEGDVYFSVDVRPALRRGLRARRGGDAAALRRARRRPRAPRQEEPARPDALDGRPPGRAELGRRPRSAAGRPGWHIECVAIALDHLGMGFDVQGGGSDLAFPHHEMGASHAQALTGEHPFAKAYVHAGMVALDGEKMSKSKGNLVFVSALRRDGRGPGGDPARPALAPLPRRLGVDRPGPRRRRRAPRPLARRGLPPRRAGRPTRWSRRSARPSPTTWTPRRRWPPWTAGPSSRAPRAVRTRGHPAWSPVPSTRCWASRSRRSGGPHHATRPRTCSVKSGAGSRGRSLGRDSPRTPRQTPGRPLSPLSSGFFPWPGWPGRRLRARRLRRPGAAAGGVP